jgi:CRISPR/Cas system-associated exonuclease Cas4 (RecB family)
MTHLKTGIKAILSARYPKPWLEEAIDDYFTHLPESYRTGTTFHPSSAGKCPRLIQLNMLGVFKKTTPPKSRRIFDTGNSMHNRYGEYFKGMGLFLDKEVDLMYEKDGVVIKGNCDYIIKDFNDTKHILELKSINSRGFTELLRSGKPIENHLLQLNIYMKCLNIYTGEILYENKDTQEIKIYEIRYNEDRFEECFAVFRRINEYMNMKPMKIVPVEYPTCNSKYCEAKEYCQGLYNEKKK